MSDFDEIVESYVPSAQSLGLTRADVERAVRSATRASRSCVACRFGRAPWQSELYALRRNALDVFHRRCERALSRHRCRDFEPLELPPVAVPQRIEEEVP